MERSVHIILLLLLCVSWCIFLAAETEQSAETLLANTTNGILQGRWMKTRNGREFKAYLGVPYATPPLGKLRFQPPEPPLSWEGVRDATVESNVCIQRYLNGSEDCLYLNVFTHKNNISVNTSLPVMVFIHGGGFYLGSSSINLYGPDFLLDRDIVLVTLQYRLGVFGFLSNEDSVMPGNMGLKDQVKALQWVQNNIHVFGGNRSRVTIFGNSAGSSSVHLHLLSPLSTELFARAISQSGTAQSTFAMIGRGTSRNITLALVKQLNCTSLITSEEILQCLQQRSSADVQNVYSQMQDSKYEKASLFRPVLEEPSEHAFLISSPLRSKTNKPWLVGVNANEGLFKINLLSFNQTIILIHSIFPQFGPEILFFDDTSSNPQKNAELIYDYYFKNILSTNETIRALEHMISDSWFNWPTVQAIHNHLGTLYCYLFAHEGEHSYVEVMGGPKGFGVSHADDLLYLFDQKQLFPTSLNEVDSRISKLLIDMWVDFAEQGNPTPQPISSNPQIDTEPKLVWEPSNNLDPKYLLIQTNHLSMTKDIFSERMSFWGNLTIRDKV